MEGNAKLLIQITWGTSKDDERSSRKNQKAQITRNLNGTVYLCWTWTRKCRETWICEMVMELGVDCSKCLGIIPGGAQIYRTQNDW